MSKGRQARILGKSMVINLNTKGGVRKSPGRNGIAKCVAPQLAGKKSGTRAAQRASFASAASSCKGKGGGRRK